MIKRILENPDLYQRIQTEVDEVFSKGIPDSETLLAMNDLNGLYRETLRLQPTGFGITRTATKNFVFKGFQVYKGEDVLIYTTAEHRNEQYFPDPLKFDIERYREPRNEHRQAAFAPFAKGPHACLGAGMSELMGPLNMGLILYNWDLKPACDLKKVKMTFNPAPVLSDNFKIKITRRNN
jgi:cytochrome P450